MRKIKVSIVLAIVDEHEQHLSHSVIHTFSPTVTVRAVGTRGDKANAEELVQSTREVAAK